ncbi:iron-binding protein [Coemansia aciculifera]|uniref:Iron-sulfur cluster assembly protein n=2 Tax=Coemansia TaxID=4863 RepID=A0A9W8GW05_9FUNG|nr:iron-binding protein [Coemansia pectinata]KAJ2858892.1 iron-binding protein [Coemansia aciculifera]KAJ2868771.1 iron-binding protein [Coemansia aciculifera]KAJ2879603.1 iron-binding protein [Coemansia aciculifera]
MFSLAKQFAFTSMRQTPAVRAATIVGSRPVLSAKRFYHERVIDHYENPRNMGSLDKSDPTVGTGLVGAPACGDVMRLQIKVDDGGKIVDVKFKTFGCGSAIASSSYITERVRGMSLDDALKIRNTDIAKELCLPPVKLHCSMLAEDAIRSAIKDFRTKRGGDVIHGAKASAASQSMAA